MTHTITFVWIDEENMSKPHRVVRFLPFLDFSERSPQPSGGLIRASGLRNLALWYRALRLVVGSLWDDTSWDRGRSGR
jgi:hypothetical protein